MKPQHKIFCLVNYLLPKVYHSLVFSKLTACSLNALDVYVRKAVSKILHLPHDLPKAAFHARIADVGRRNPCLRFKVPIIARNRLKYKVVPAYLFSVNNRRIDTINQLNSYWRDRLRESCDCASLREVTRFPSTHSWVNGGTSLMTGSDYIRVIYIRYWVLFSKARVVRGRTNKDKTCRSGCGAVETLNHILKTFYSTYHLKK